MGVNCTHFWQYRTEDFCLKLTPVSGYGHIYNTCPSIYSLWDSAHSYIATSQACVLYKDIVIQSVQSGWVIYQVEFKTDFPNLFNTVEPLK